MHTLQTNPQQFVYQATVPLPHTLDEYRMHTSYAKDSSFAAKAVRPALIIAFSIGAVLLGLNYFHSDDDNAQTDTVSTSPALRTPAMPSAPATRSLPMPAEEPIAKAPAVIEPANSTTKPAEVNSAPLGAPGKHASSESTKPVKAKSSVAAKVPATTAKKIEPIPVATPLELIPPQQDVAPTPPPVPAPIPAVDPPQPTPAPVTPPVEPSK